MSAAVHVGDVIDFLGAAHVVASIERHSFYKDAVTARDGAGFGVTMFPGDERRGWLTCPHGEQDPPRSSRLTGANLPERWR